MKNCGSFADNGQSALQTVNTIIRRTEKKKDKQHVLECQEEYKLLLNLKLKPLFLLNDKTYFAVSISVIESRFLLNHC